MITGMTKRATCCLLVALLFVGFPGMGLSRAAGTAEKAASAESALSVLSEPEGATVYVDGEAKGVTPLQLDELLSGDHRVTLAKDGYLENSRVLSLEAGRTQTVDVKLTPASNNTRHSIQIETAEEGGSNKLKWIIPVAAGGGVAAYLLLRDTNDPPAVENVSISPSGPGLEAVTEFSFTAQGASDPDNDPLTYSWDFGDGSSGSGPTARHTYNSAGAFNVTVTVSDGKESATARGNVTVGSLTGTWTGHVLIANWAFRFDLTQSGITVTGTYSDQDGSGSVTGSVSAPLNVTLTVNQPQYQPFTFSGTLDSSLNRITGIAFGLPFEMARQ